MNLPEMPGQNINGRNAASVAPVGRHHRPEHPLRGERVRGVSIEAFDELSVGVFGDDDRAVDDQAESEQQPEHHHEVVRVADQIDRSSARTGTTPAPTAPTMMPLRTPIDATTTIITSASAVMMLPCSSVTCSCANGAWSCV